MGKYFDLLMEDVRMREGLHSCMNCGVCTGVCPAAEFYNYDPRQIVNIVQTRDDEAIEEAAPQRHDLVLRRVHVVPSALPAGQYAGVCDPGTPAAVAEARPVRRGEKGRQQLALKRIIGDNILRTGYCLVPRLVKPELHPEQGTVWQWIYDNDKEVYGRFTPVYMKQGAGALRRIDDESLDEIRRIFDVSGGREMFDDIERHSDRKAREMGYSEGAGERYLMDVFTTNSNEHD